MDSFLDQQRERGALDSTGGFSVNPFKALAKMAAFQSQDPGFYLLRLVQTGVLLSSSAVEIVLGRDEVSVTFREPELELLEPQRVETSFGKPLSEDDDIAFTFFMNGLNHALARRPQSLSVVWVYSDGTVQSLRASEEKFSLETTSRQSGSAALQVKFGREHDAGQIAAETQSVHNRCASCPVPVLLDGQNVVTRTNPESSLYQGDYVSGYAHGFLPNHYVFGEHYLRWLNSGPGLALPPAGKRRAQFRTNPEDNKPRASGSKSDVFLLSRGTQDYDGLIRVTSDFSYSGTVSYIQAGVVLSKKPVRAAGVRAFVCVDGMPTDLSGTELMESLKLTQLQDLLRAELANHLEEIQSHLESLKARFDWTFERKLGAGFSAVLGGAYLWSGIVLLPVPVLGKAWAMGMLASTGVASHIGLRSRQTLDSDLREFVRGHIVQGIANQKESQ